MQTYPGASAGAENQLSLSIDGVPLRGASQNHYLLQALKTQFTVSQRCLIDDIHRNFGRNVGVIASHFDDAPMLFRALEFHTDTISSEDLGVSDLRIALMSCPHRFARLDAIDVQCFIEHGGIMVTSDRAIRLPGVSSFIPHLDGSAPRRARLKIAGVSNDGYLPAVWLDAGHVPLDGMQFENLPIEVLAYDSLTGEPLAVYAGYGRGGIIHSVAHWLQPGNPEQSTSAERRRLKDAPDLRTIGNSYPEITLGSYLAQKAMLDVLFCGLEWSTGGVPHHISQQSQQDR